MAVRHPLCQSVDPVPARLRRKFVRLAGGNACHRRIMSRSARSLSLATAASFLFLLFAARASFKCLLQYVDHREIARTTRGSLALDDVSQRGHADRRIT